MIALHLRELQGKSMPELAALLAQGGAPRVIPHDRHEAILAILQRATNERRALIGEGVLEILPDGFGFLRNPTYDYQPVLDDLYVSPAQIRRFHLLTGDYVAGVLRAPKGTEKYFAVMYVEHVNGRPSDARRPTGRLETLAAKIPSRRIRLSRPGSPAGALLDRLAPLAFGQRGLVLGEHGSGLTTLLGTVARDAAANHPEALVLLVLIETVPETLGELRARLRGTSVEVVATVLDQPSQRHVHALDLTVERAKRVAESGRDVVLLVDSLDRVARAYLLETQPLGREVAPGLDAGALQRMKRLLGAARAVESGGSLTLLSTLPLSTGSRIDDALLEELAPFASWQVKLDVALARQGRFPAIDARSVWSRSADRLVDAAELAALAGERAALAELDAQGAWERTLGGSAAAS